MLDRLPYEVFREIIKSLYVYTSHGLTPMNPDETTLPPIEASHVCRSWRIALLSDSSLWTCIIIPQMPPDEVHELLRRSGTAPLHVFIDPIDGHLQPDTLASAFRAIDRFQTLQIIFENENDDARMQVFLILPYLNRPAPMLQKFYLNIEEGRGWAINEEFLRKLFSSGNISNSQQHIESEIRVKYHECLRSPGQLFRNLSGLHLKVGPSTVFADALLDVIELSPSLRILDIHSILTPEVSDTPGRTVYLPRLQRLSLSGSPDVAMVNLVLGHLTFQRENVVWNISCVDFLYKQSDLLLRLLAQLHFTFLEIHNDIGHEQVHLDFSTHSCNPWGLESSRFRISHDVSFEPVDNLPDSLQVFRLSLITHLVLGSTPLSSYILRNISVSLVNLERCHIDHRRSHYWSNTINASCLMALVPWHARRQAQQQAGMGQGPSDLMGFLDIVVSQDVDDSNSSAACTMFPCPSLATLYIDIIDGGWEMDKRYARLLAACSEIRQQERHPFSLIIIRCWKSSLTDDVQAMLQPHDGFPIAIEFRD